MGNVYAHRGRLAPAVILVVLMALAVIATLGIMAGPASANASFATCANCHTGAATHAVPAHTACATCHVNGFGAPNKGVTSAACATCHEPVSDVLAKPVHSANACGTTPGCHGVPPAVATTTMTLKALPTRVKLRKTVKFSGLVGPLPALAGTQVNLKVDRKVGKRWVKMATVKAFVGPAGAYSTSYKAAKLGPHRVTAAITKTSTHTAKTAVKAFTVVR